VGRQRVCLLFSGAMVDLLAWLRCVFVSLRQFLERNRYDDSARALLDLPAFIHAAGNTLPLSTTSFIFVHERLQYCRNLMMTQDTCSDHMKILSGR